MVSCPINIVNINFTNILYIISKLTYSFCHYKHKLILKNAYYKCMKHFTKYFYLIISLN